jgi:hypothetical protein
MTQERFKQTLTRIENWMNTPTSSTAQPTKLRWWVTPNLFDKYFCRAIILATFACTFYFFGCSPTTTSSAAANEYIGVWENAHAPELTMTITPKGDQFVVHTMELGGRDRLADLKNGLLQFNDGTGTYLEHHKDADTLTSSGNSQFLYRRKK